MQARRFIVVPHWIEPAWRQVYSKTCTEFWFTAGLYFASVLLGDALDEGQPDAPTGRRAFTLRSSATRLKAALSGVRRNHRTPVPNLHHDPRALAQHPKSTLLPCRWPLSGVPPP